MHLINENVARDFEQTLQASDGCNIHYRAWRPAEAASHAVLLFHRGHEHSGRLAEVVRYLNFKNIWVFAWDARGHGKSGRPLQSFDQLVSDAREFIGHVSTIYDIPVSNMSVVAHSFSAVALIDCLQKHKLTISSLVLLAPAFSINLFLPGAWSVLCFIHAFAPNISIPSYVTGRMLTRSREEAIRYDRDPAITRNIPLSVLLGLRAAAIGALKNASEIQIPTLLLIAGDDLVAGVKEQEQFFHCLSGDYNAMNTYPAMRHDMFHELERESLLDSIREHALKHFTLSKI